MDAKRLIIGISGASGTIYGIRLLEVLREVENIETHLIMSNAAKRTLLLETDYSVEAVETLANCVHRMSDIAASISSGSYLTLGMVVAPCSMKTLSGIVSSYADNLLLRAADVTLKDRRKLILLPREAPLHLGHLRLLTQATEMGAIILPPLPAFYHYPQTIQDLVDHTIGRVLDLLGIAPKKDLFQRWEGAQPGKH